MTLSRRQFVHNSAVATVAAMLPTHRLWGSPITSLDHGRLAAQRWLSDPADVRALALRAVDAAKSAGAAYADVRLTRTVDQMFEYRSALTVGGGVSDADTRAVGIRVLVNGYWGFAASPFWKPDEMGRLAHEAVLQAKQNALGSAKHVDLGTVPVVTGTWTTPGIDPFSVSIEEKIDFIDGWRQAIADLPPADVVARPYTSRMFLMRQERAMASTEGTYIQQTLYQTRGNFDVHVASGGGETVMHAGGLAPEGRGWDAFLEANIKAQIPKLIAEAAELLMAPHQPVEIGRFDVVFDAAAAGELLDATIGIAAQVDRALGYEANTGGTSYLGPDPLARLGTFAIGTPQLTVTADRSLPGGAATVKWDDEGVAPTDFTLVKNGVLVDYQTTREQAAWLAPWYQGQGMPVRSHGCAGAPDALHIPIQHTPNLAMTPAPTTASFADLVATTRKGIAIMGGGVSTDFQCLTGIGVGLIREITNGKLDTVLTRGGYLFNTLELWKNVVAMGGPNSTVRTSALHSKGQPSQNSTHTITAVPMVVKNVSLIDITRRA